MFVLPALKLLKTLYNDNKPFLSTYKTIVKSNYYKKIKLFENPVVLCPHQVPLQRFPKSVSGLVLVILIFEN